MPEIKHNKGVKLFISYSRKDKKYKDKLLQHLAGVLKSEFIEVWNDHEILPGIEWEPEIKKRLEESDIILCLISINFMTSNYIQDIELKKAFERHEAGNILIIPIIVDFCDLSSLPISKFQALPENANPLTNWRKINEGYLNVVEGIKRVLSQFHPIKRDEIESERLEELNATLTKLKGISEDSPEFEKLNDFEIILRNSLTEPDEEARDYLQKFTFEMMNLQFTKFWMTAIELEGYTKNFQKYILKTLKDIYGETGPIIAMHFASFIKLFKSLQEKKNLPKEAEDLLFSIIFSKEVEKTYKKLSLETILHFNSSQNIHCNLKIISLFSHENIEKKEPFVSQIIEGFIFPDEYDSEVKLLSSIWKNLDRELRLKLVDSIGYYLYLNKEKAGHIEKYFSSLKDLISLDFESTLQIELTFKKAREIFQKRNKSVFFLKKILNTHTDESEIYSFIKEITALSQRKGKKIDTAVYGSILDILKKDVCEKIMSIQGKKFLLRFLIELCANEKVDGFVSVFAMFMLEQFFGREVFWLDDRFPKAFFVQRNFLFFEPTSVINALCDTDGSEEINERDFLNINMLFYIFELLDKNDDNVLIGQFFNTLQQHAQKNKRIDIFIRYLNDEIDRNRFVELISTL